MMGLIPQTPGRVKQIALYETLFRELRQHGVDIHFKGRPGGETLEWLGRFIDVSDVYACDDPPADIRGRNMVFIMIGPATSGVYEAVGRGIPVIRSAVPGTLEYLEINKELFPVLPPQAAVIEAIRLTNRNAYDERVNSQKKWLRSELFIKDNVFSSSLKWFMTVFR